MHDNHSFFFFALVDESFVQQYLIFKAVTVQVQQEDNWPAGGCVGGGTCIVQSVSCNHFYHLH